MQELQGRIRNFFHFQWEKTLAILHCFYEMRASGKSSIESEHRTILGCASPSITGRGYVLFITESFGVGMTLDLDLLPAAALHKVEEEQVNSLLIGAFGSRSEASITRYSRAEIQIVSIIARMFEAEELKE